MSQEMSKGMTKGMSQEMSKGMTKPELNPNKAFSEKPRYYFYICTDSSEDLKKYYEYLREFEEITKEKEKSVIQVMVNSVKETENIPSKLSHCFRVNEYKDREDFPWYNYTNINNSHHMIKLKRINNLPDIYDLEDIINEVKLIHENENMLIVHYNFAINSC